MLYIGTSGYYFSDWIGTVYPEDLSKSQLLKYYASVWKFDAVELNFTYYTIPSYKTVVSMLRKTPQTFVFSVKMPGSVTHEGWKNLILPEDDIEKTLSALQPMISENRLKIILAQFPYAFRYCDDNLQYLQRLRNMVKEPLAIEFRHRSWDNEKVYEFLSSSGLSFVIVDEPRMKELFPYKPIKTSRISYFRFHGRNEKWFYSSTERYDYDYSEEELRVFSDDIAKMLKESQDVFVFFNNCYRGKALQNALTLRSILENTVLRS
ncbi:MAG TPA: DUF72 domain-containing protein [Pseudothermotoga sp.]|nr:DUF72 domain-containing protein [Pseudothermotoga sp.]HOK82944.1 DUF72 domain-containing protein [Pseudothermotoga sp.]HPP69882.1 DUF72 domain-containing protein [Pseudothermotoga sp.]